MFIIIVPHYWVAVNRSQKFHPATTWRYPPPKHQAIPSSAKRRGVGPSHWSPRCPRPADGIWMDFTSSGNSNPPVLKSRKVENFHIFWGKYHLYITYISPIYDMYIITILHHVFSTIDREIIPGRFTGGSKRQAKLVPAGLGWMDLSENTTERTYYITGWWFIWTINHGIETTNQIT